jgi:LIVCS family branched-chain amino acid:cation transporter
MRNNLSLKELLILGGGLFSMHFGAACLLYPVTWGADAGSAVYLTYIGIFLSGILLPYMGYLALVRGRGDFLTLIRRAAPNFGLIMVMLMILILGPFFMMPRISAAMWSALLQLAGRDFGRVAGFGFNCAVYLAVYFFVASQGKVVDRIGRLFFPVLVTIVAAVILQSIITPLAPRVPPVFKENPVLHGFLAAYAAGDLQCALVYGLVVIHGIRNAGIDAAGEGRALLKVGGIGLGLLALAHLGHMIAGANTGGTIRLNLSALYVQMVLELWGSKGGLIFFVALAMACMTATMGAASSTASLWAEIFKGRVSYRLICAVTCITACLVSSAGLDKIISVIGPILDAMYPATIVLTLYYCLCRTPFSNRSLIALKAALAAAVILGAAALLHCYVGLFGLNLQAFEKFYAALPLSAYSMAWVPVSAAVYFIAWLCASRVTGEVPSENFE